MKILVVDDDTDLRSLVRFALMQAGFMVCTAADGTNALVTFDSELPDLVVLDINLPGLNGLDVCREIRRHSAVPILVLTARYDENELVAAIDCGADDCMRKPFSARVLLARIRALARRSSAVLPQTLSAGQLQLEVDNQLLRIGTTIVSLTPLEIRMLGLLIATPGRTIATERLLIHLWGVASTHERSTLKQLVYRLRAKIGAALPGIDIVQTTPGAGYKLIPVAAGAVM
jgi:DNA-binding response OmpR family regulator